MGIYEAFDPVEAPVAAAAPPPVFGFGGDTLAAGWKAGKAGTDWGLHQANYENDIRDQLADELRKRGRDVPHYDFASVRTGRRLKTAGADVDPLMKRRIEDADRFWGLVAEEKSRDPKFAAQFASLIDEDSVQSEALVRRQRDEDAAGEVYSRSTGLGKTAWWVGNFATGFTDPLSYIPIGGGVSKGATIAAKILNTAGREAAINAAAQIALEPLIQVDAAARGQDRGVGDVAVDVGFAAGLGGLLGAGEAGLTMALSRPGEGRAALDAIVDGIGPERLTPDEKAAIHVLTRELDIKEVSPFVPSPEGDKAHGTRLATALAHLEADLPVPDMRSRLNSSTTLSRPAVIDWVIDVQEGGSTRVVDSGGVTRYGISADANPDVNVESLGRDGARRIYKERYWDALDLDVVEPRLAAVAFDASVNHGPAKAREMMVEAEGDVSRLLELRREEYARLVAADPEKYGRYEKGWENRLAKLEEKIGGVEAGPVLRPELFDDPEAYRLAQAADDGPEESPFSFSEGGDQRSLGDGVTDAPSPFVASLAPADKITASLPKRVEGSAFDAVDYMPAMRAYVGDRSRSLNPEAISRKLGVQLEEARVILGKLASSGDSGLYVTKGRVIPEKRNKAGAVTREMRVIPSSIRRKIARNGPVDVLTALADAGGIQDVKRHNLKAGRNLQRMIPGAGPLIRKDGMTIEQAGELLWEKGFFGPPETQPRPTEAQVLDMLDRGAFAKVYAPEDVLDAVDAKLSAESDVAMQQARAEIERVAEQLGGLELTDAEMSRALDEMALGASPDAALEQAIRNEGFDSLEAGSIETGDDDYDIPGFDDDRFKPRSDQETGPSGERQAGGGADARERRADQPESPEDRSFQGDPADPAPSLSRFADPAGEGPKAQLASIEHDLRMELGFDPAIAGRQRQQAELGAASPLRNTAEQDGTMGLGLFDAADQPMFRLADEGAEVTLDDILKQAEADEAAIKAARDCL